MNPEDKNTHPACEGAPWDDPELEARMKSRMAARFGGLSVDVTKPKQEARAKRQAKARAKSKRARKARRRS